AVMLVTHPPRGLTRYWDAFAPGGVALSLLAAWLVARAIAGARSAWLAVAVVAGTLVPGVQWLAHFADADRGAARIQALADEPPSRSGGERASNLNFLGDHAFAASAWSDAARAYARSAEAEPNARTFVQ